MICTPVCGRSDERVAAESLNLAQLAQFDDIVDVRSPSEFMEDHIPGALNFPVLNDEERARVGTIYKQVSPFEAKKIGAALVARNIALHVEQHFASKPRGWRPLVYCWRGGSRSGAMTHILKQIGWKADQLAGGYKAYRRTVLEKLQILPAPLRFHVVCGPTGSGKSRFLSALERVGAQVLDLEKLAAHRGSILGSLPQVGQPPQKLFESLLWAELQKFDPARPVFVEAESKKIGNVRVPDALLEAMWRGRCIRLEVNQEQRVALLMEEYRHFLEHPASLVGKLDYLAGIYGKKQIKTWQELARQGDWRRLVTELLEKHYDPAYTRSTLKHYPRYHEGVILPLTDLSERGCESAARGIIGCGGLTELQQMLRLN
jgi:tRNA 2-selenouridine synthase